MSTHIRRYGIWKWEWKYECSHSIAWRTMTISCFHARKFFFWTCQPKSMPISQLPPHSVPLIDLWRRWYILTHNRKPLIWRQHTGSPLTQHSRRRRWWHRRTLPDSISWWQFLDGRTYSREAPVHTWRFPIWSVPLSMSLQFKSATPHSKRCHTVHRSWWHLWNSWCYGICQWWCTQPGWYLQTVKKIQMIVYKLCLIKTLEPPVICCWSKTHLWIVAHLCTIWIYNVKSFEPYLKVLK